MSKFFTYEDRLEIEACLKQDMTFGAIAKKLEKHRTTISKEIQHYSIERKSGYAGYPYNACIHRFGCTKQHVCPGECRRPTSKTCNHCSCCNDFCPEFEEELCANRFSPPYVCNGCSQLYKCTLRKTIYDAIEAHKLSAEHLSEARSGILADEAELQRMNEIVSPLVKRGQSIHHIYSAHVDELMCSEKTIYNYIDASLLDVGNIDLPRKVRYRPRYKKPEFKVDKGCRIGRTYRDFLDFMEKHPDYPVVQMDTVCGGHGGPVLLTIHFVETGLMLAFLRKANTSQSVIDIINQLYYHLGRNHFERLFPVILTDNGSEFSNPKAVEFAPDSIRRTCLFYCDPNSPYQKGSIEVNHELIRRIIPKGRSFESLTQEDINLMMNHINSYKRKKLNDRSPIQAFSFYYGEEFLRLLGCEPVPAGAIILKPSLLKK